MTSRICVFFVFAAACLWLHPANAYAQGMSKEEIGRQRTKASELHKQGKFAEEAALYEQILLSAEKVHGKGDLTTGIILNNLAVAYYDLRQYKKAEPLYLRALPIHEAKAGKEDLRTAIVLYNLGDVYRALSHNQTAESYYLRCLSIREAKLVKDHADLIAVLNNLANVYRALPGQNAKAESQYVRVLQILEAKHGKNHIDLVPALNNLGALYRVMDQKANAEAQYSRSLQIVEAKYGKDHPNGAVPLSNLAMIYLGLGEHAKAEPLFLRHLHNLEVKNGKDDPGLVLYLYELAKLYRATFQYAKAEPLYERSLRISEAKNAKSKFAVAVACTNLADLYRDMGEYTKAEPFYQRALNLRMANYGKSDGSVATALANLASLYRDTLQYKKAEPLFLRSLEIREAFGKTNANVAASLNDLSRLYEAMGQYAQAEERCVRGLEIREAAGKETPAVAQSLATLGYLYKTLGQYSKAEPLYQRALQIREDKNGKDHPEAALAMNNLAHLYAEMGQYSKAEPLVLRGMEIREAKLAKDHPMVAASQSQLASLYRAMGQSLKAESLFLKALAIQEAKLGRNHPTVATTLNNLAVLYNETGQPKKAEGLYLRSLAIYESKYGKDHPSVATSLNNLANVYIALGQFDKAAPLCERSRKLREERYGSTTHPTIAHVLRTQASIAWAKHEPEQAIELQQQAIEIYRARLGKDHPTTSHAMSRLASYLNQTDHAGEAVRTMDQSLRGLRLHAARVLPILPESEQLGFMVNSFEKDFLAAVSLGLNPKISEDNRLRTAGWVLNGKSIIHQSLAERLLLARDNQSGDSKRVLNDLEDVRHQLARLKLQGASAADEASYRKKFDALRTRETSLESRLYTANSSQRQDPWVEIDELRQKLNTKSVYIDFLRFTPTDFSSPMGQRGKKLPPVYVAWVSTRDKETVIINLGSAEKIDAAIQVALKELQEAPKRIQTEGEQDAEDIVRAKLAAVSKLVLEPLMPHVARYPQWILGPDGDLWLIPWACLPLDKEQYVLEKHTLRYVTSGRDLVLNLLQLDHRSSAPVIFADPDFDRQPNQLGGSANRTLAGKKLPGRIGNWDIIFDFKADGQVIIRDQDPKGTVAGQGSWKLQGKQLIVQTSLSRFEGTMDDEQISGQRVMAKKDGTTSRDAWHLQLPENGAQAFLRSYSFAAPRQIGRVGRLPGTADEADAITPALKKWAGGIAPRRFIDKDATVGAFQQLKGPKVLVLSTHGYFQPDQKVPENQRNRVDDPETRSAAVGIENPLLRSGLLLAGCNHSAKSKVGQETGILTGLEIVGTDLRGTELVVLSACETGLGDIHNGEGVAGLRQAFQLAGAQTVVASLWKISDRETALLMKSFFEKMAAGQNKVDALRDAQLSMLRERRERNAAAHPFYWGAFTLTGR